MQSQNDPLDALLFSDANYPKMSENGNLANPKNNDEKLYDDNMFSNRYLYENSLVDNSNR